MMELHFLFILLFQYHKILNHFSPFLVSKAILLKKGFLYTQNIIYFYPFRHALTFLQGLCRFTAYFLIKGGDRYDILTFNCRKFPRR